MQLIELTLNHYNFYCPVTGECISADSEPINYDATSLRGYWVSEELETPWLCSKDFSDAYILYLKECAKNNYEDDENNYFPNWQEIEAFLKEYNEPNWVVFNLTTRLSDQQSTNAWYVIDLSLRTKVTPE